MKVRAKNPAIEAFRLPAKREGIPGAFMEWAREVEFTNWESGDEIIEIELDHTACLWEGVEPGDWIVEVQPGEFRSVTAGEFARRYEAVK